MVPSQGVTHTKLCITPCAAQVNFTMGWWEPSEKRRRHARSRMPERVGLVAQSQAQLVVG